MSNTEFPRKTNSLLSQAEKNFLDDVPDEGVRFIFNNMGDSIRLSFVANDLSRNELYDFEDERAQAVRDYYEMLFAFGVRTDPREP